MKLLIVEPHASGHHASYLRWLIKGARACGWQPIIATTLHAMTHPAMASIAAEFVGLEIHRMAGIAESHTGSGAAALLTREFGYWQVLRTAVLEVTAKVRIDAVALPYVDYCFHVLALLGSPFGKLPWCAISMRLGTTQLKKRSVMPFKWRLARRLLTDRYLSALFVINPSVTDVPDGWFKPRMLAKLRYLPDPAECLFCGSRSEVRNRLGIGTSMIAVLIFGYIDTRKGVDALLGALQGETALADFVVVLAGLQSTQFAANRTPAYIELQAQGRLVVMNHVIAEEEKCALLSAADIMWVGYQRHLHMSGVLALAGIAALPVAGSAEGEIGRLLSAHGLGTKFRLERRSEIVEALASMRDAAVRREMGRIAFDLFRSHTPAAFGSAVMAAFSPGAALGN